MCTLLSQSHYHGEVDFSNYLHQFVSPITREMGFVVDVHPKSIYKYYFISTYNYFCPIMYLELILAILKFIDIRFITTILKH